VAEWLYLNWASRAPQPLPVNFVHAEWITLHDNPGFRGFVNFLRAKLDRIGPAQEDLCRDFFQRAVALELSFFEAAYPDRTPANRRACFFTLSKRKGLPHLSKAARSTISR
jgi:thiaminase/transcriptional activator TenA